MLENLLVTYYVVSCPLMGDELENRVHCYSKYLTHIGNINPTLEKGYMRDISAIHIEMQ